MSAMRKPAGCLPCGYRRGGPVRPRRGAVLYYLGLGANLGDRLAAIQGAVALLAESGRVLKRSSVYETTPVGMAGSNLFLNMVLVLESGLAPLDLLVRCQEHEAAMGRDADHSRFRDRVIDIDILLAGDKVIRTPELTVPHPRLAERGFVLVPLFEIAPKLVHPVEKVTVARLLSRLKSTGTVRRLD